MQQSRVQWRLRNHSHIQGARALTSANGQCGRLGDVCMCRYLGHFVLHLAQARSCASGSTNRPPSRRHQPTAAWSAADAEGAAPEGTKALSPRPPSPQQFFSFFVPKAGRRDGEEHGVEGAGWDHYIHDCLSDLDARGDAATILV